MRLRSSYVLFVFVLPAILGATPAPTMRPDATAIKLVDQLIAHPDDPLVPNDTTHRDLLRMIASVGDAPISEMVARLLAMPGADQDPQGKMNSARWQLIRDIGEIGDRSIHPLQAALTRAKTFLQRTELVQGLAAIRTPAGTQALLLLKDDKDAAIRINALDSLISRLESHPDQGGDPQLLSILIKHAPGEKNENIRASLCWAVRAELKTGELAEKPDPARVTLAASYLRDRLANDSSDDVRFSAACALTEFGDNSGKTVLKKAALALQAAKGNGNFDFSLEQLVPAIERVSGQKFGPVPLNPLLSSNTRQIPALKDARNALIDRVAKWAKDDATF